MRNHRTKNGLNGGAKRAQKKSRVNSKNSFAPGRTRATWIFFLGLGPQCNLEETLKGVHHVTNNSFGERETDYCYYYVIFWCNSGWDFNFELFLNKTYIVCLVKSIILHGKIIYFTPIFSNWSVLILFCFILQNLNY